MRKQELPANAFPLIELVDDPLSLEQALLC